MAIRYTYFLLMTLFFVAAIPQWGSAETGFHYQRPSPLLQYSLDSPLGITKGTTAIDSVHYKDPGKAVRLSLFHTTMPLLAGYVLIDNRRNWGAPDGEVLAFIGGFLTGYGIIVGPAIGHSYAKSNDAAGIFVRTGGALLATGGVHATIGCALAGCEGGAAALVFVGTLAGVGLTLGNAIYHIATADDEAREHNKNLTNNNISIVPAYYPRHNAAGVTARLQL